MSDEPTLAMFWFMLCVTVCSCLVTCQRVNDSWREQIEKHGAAEFYLDANNDRQWRWKEPK